MLKIVNSKNKHLSKIITKKIKKKKEKQTTQLEKVEYKIKVVLVCMS